MLKADRKIALSLMLSGTGYHTASWRHPNAPRASDLNFDFYKSIVLEAERQIYDMLFVADTLYFPRGKTAAAGRRFPNIQYEPVTFLSALAVVTKRIGLGGTISTTYSPPYQVARMTAALDQLSGGRAGWNVVTSMKSAEALNFGFTEHLEHAQRYARAAEFLDVVKALWDSWEDEAYPLDKTSEIAYDPDKVHACDHKGSYFSVAGPLNLARPPQGHPIIIQAGSSEPGQEMAAASADVVFTAQNSFESAQAFYAGLKARMPKYGRDSTEILVLPGFVPIIGATELEARKKFQQLQDLIDPQLGVAQLSSLLGDIDLSGVDLEKPLPELPQTNAGKSRFALLTRLSEDSSLTVRELYQKVAGTRGHFVIVGTAEQVADEMARWFKNGAADGFNIMPAILPSAFDDFNHDVLPILRERGLLKNAYWGATLRENLGLARPKNVHLEEAGVKTSSVGARSEKR